MFLFESLLSILWGYIPRSGIAGSYGNSMFNFFEELPNCSPQPPHHFTFPTQFLKKMNVRSCPQLCLVPLPQGPRAPLRPGSETPPHHQAQLVGAAGEVSAAQQDAALINSSLGRKWCPQSCSQGLCTGGSPSGEAERPWEGSWGWRTQDSTASEQPTMVSFQSVKLRSPGVREANLALRPGSLCPSQRTCLHLPPHKIF